MASDKRIQNTVNDLMNTMKNTMPMVFDTPDGERTLTVFHKPLGCHLTWKNGKYELGDIEGGHLAQLGAKSVWSIKSINGKSLAGLTREQALSQLKEEAAHLSGSLYCEFEVPGGKKQQIAIEHEPVGFDLTAKLPLTIVEVHGHKFHDNLNRPVPSVQVGWELTEIGYRKLADLTYEQAKIIMFAEIALLRGHSSQDERQKAAELYTEIYEESKLPEERDVLHIDRVLAHAHDHLENEEKRKRDQEITNADRERLQDIQGSATYNAESLLNEMLSLLMLQLDLTKEDAQDLYRTRTRVKVKMDIYVDGRVCVTKGTQGTIMEPTREALDKGCILVKFEGKHSSSMQVCVHEVEPILFRPPGVPEPARVMVSMSSHIPVSRVEILHAIANELGIQVQEVCVCHEIKVENSCVERVLTSFGSIKEKISAEEASVTEGEKMEGYTRLHIYGYRKHVLSLIALVFDMVFQLGDEIQVESETIAELELSVPKPCVVPRGRRGKIVKIENDGCRIVEWHGIDGRWPVALNLFADLQKVQANLTQSPNERGQSSDQSDGPSIASDAVKQSRGGRGANGSVGKSINSKNTPEPGHLGEVWDSLVANQPQKLEVPLGKDPGLIFTTEKDENGYYDVVVKDVLDGSIKEANTKRDPLTRLTAGSIIKTINGKDMAAVSKAELAMKNIMVAQGSGVALIEFRHASFARKQAVMAQKDCEMQQIGIQVSKLNDKATPDDLGPDGKKRVAVGLGQVQQKAKQVMDDWKEFKALGCGVSENPSFQQERVFQIAQRHGYEHQVPSQTATSQRALEQKERWVSMPGYLEPVIEVSLPQPMDLAQAKSCCAKEGCSGFYYSDGDIQKDKIPRIYVCKNVDIKQTLFPWRSYTVHVRVRAKEGEQVESRLHGGRQEGTVLSIHPGKEGIKYMVQFPNGAITMIGDQFSPKNEPVDQDLIDDKFVPRSYWCCARPEGSGWAPSDERVMKRGHLEVYPHYM